MKDTYTAISCQIYDKLELFAIKKTQIKITYIKDNQENILEDFVSDIQTKNKEEFLILQSGIKIRLDKILSINDEEVIKTC